MPRVSWQNVINYSNLPCLRSHSNMFKNYWKSKQSKNVQEVCTSDCLSEPWFCEGIPKTCLEQLMYEDLLRSGLRLMVTGHHWMFKSWHIWVIMPNWWIFKVQLMNSSRLLQGHRDICIDRIFMTPDWQFWTILHHKYVNRNMFIFPS